VTGAFQLVLPYKSNYSIYAETEGYYPKRDTINMRHLGFYKIRGKDLYMQKMEVGVAIRLNNIFFETGDAKLLASSFDELDELAVILKKNPSMELDINGFTDNVGNKDANLVLSKNRAKSVMLYLEGRGISSDRLNFKGFGEANPLNDNSTDEKRRLNRRVEFMITRQ
jgi:OmpA-OmpF porin, OOP family